MCYGVLMVWLLTTLAFADDITPTPLPPVEVSPKETPQETPEETPEPGTLVLEDGQRLYGNVLHTSLGYRIFLESGVAIDVPAEAVRRLVKGKDTYIELDRGRRVRIGASSVATRGRSIVGPTALPLGAGNGYISQRQIAATIVGIGITDGIELSAGAVLPLLGNDYSRMAVLGAKISVPASETLYTAVALEGLFLFGSNWVAPHALVTWTPAGGSTYTLGGGSAVDVKSGDTAGLLMISGAWPVAPRVSFLGEFWLLSGELPYGPSSMVMPGTALRFFLRDWSIDAGFVPFDSSFGTRGAIIPLPWFDVTWNFGRPD